MPGKAHTNPSLTASLQTGNVKQLREQVQQAEERMKVLEKEVEELKSDENEKQTFINSSEKIKRGVQDALRYRELEAEVAEIEQRIEKKKQELKEKSGVAAPLDETLRTMDAKKADYLEKVRETSFHGIASLFFAACFGLFVLCRLRTGCFVADCKKNTSLGARIAIQEQLTATKQDLRKEHYANADENYRLRLIAVKTKELSVQDLGKYHKALDK